VKSESRISWAICAVVLSAAASHAPAAQQRSGEYSLSGTVVNSRTGEPVRRALVHLTYLRETAQSVPDDGATPDQAAFTDVSGVFWFKALVAGDFVVSAQKPGFAEPLSVNGTVQVKLTGSVSDIRLTLTPLGVVTGKVVDQNGRPVRNANIVALTFQMIDGQRQAQIERQNVSTDDRGIYRLWALRPCRLYVEATGRTGGTRMYSADEPPPDVLEESFAPAYFGGAKDLGSAVPLEIEAGTEARADLAVKLEPAYRIRGSISGFVPHRPLSFVLQSGEEETSVSRVAVNSDTGTFQIYDVLSGSYTLRVGQDGTAAEIAVNVNGADRDGVEVVLAAGVDIGALTRFTNEPQAEPIQAGSPGLYFLGGQCSTQLISTLRSTAHRYFSKPSAQGEGVTFQGVLPGTYRASISCTGAHVRSASFGTQDLLANPVVTIRPDVAPPPIEIVATYGGGSIAATFSGKLPPESRTHVLLVPQFEASTGPLMTAIRAAGESGGQFEFRSLAPGAYLLYAFSSDEDVEYRNPKFLQSLTGGVRVEVEDNSETKVTLSGVVR
jgi:hypothetical protein